MDALYEQDTCTEYDHYDDPEYVDIENPECQSIPPPDKRSHGEVEADEDDVFNIFVKKFKKSDIVDKDINQKLADMINSTFREGMTDESYNDILKNIHRPENCYALKETRVNAGVWSVLKPQTQTEDSKIRGIQNSVVKASVNIAKLIDKAAPTFDEETLEWGSNALALLGQANKWLNIRRREAHKKDMDPKLHYLCSTSIPYTDLLYGDSMIKDIKDIQEMNKISRNVARGSAEAEVMFHGL